MSDNNTILNGTTVDNIDSTAANSAPVVVDNVTSDNKEPPVLSNLIETDNIKSFIDSLNPDFKESKALQNFKDANDLAKSYLSLNSLLGKKVSDWSKEDVEGFANKLGRPESSDKYTLPEELGEEATKNLKNVMFKAGLSQEQAKILIDEIIVDTRSKEEVGNKQLEEQRKVAEDLLKKEFGDAYEKRINVAVRAVKEVGGEELLKIINDSGLGANPTVVKAFAKLGMDYFESDKIVQGDKSGVFGITPSEAKKRIDTILAQPHSNKAYFDKFHPEHELIVNEIRTLGEIAFQQQ
jgi:hypothetical protein